MPELLLCTAIFTLALLSVNSATETELVETGEAPVNQTWTCPPGWSTYPSDTQPSCLFVSTETSSYRTANDKCRDLGWSLVTIEDEQKRNFLKALAIQSNTYWVGLYKPIGDDEVNSWQTLNTEEDLRNERKRNYYNGNSYCVYIFASVKNLDSGSCSNSRYSICEQEVSCKPEYYGYMCELECHCLRERCDQELENGPDSLVCKYGCQANWTGVACNIEKKHPEVNYYCISSADDSGKYVYITINTKGLQYRAIYGLTSNKVRGEWCNSTTTERHSSNLTTIRIPVNNTSIAQMSSGECAGQQLGKDTFSWSIVLKEYDGYLQEMDGHYKITCDFSAADNMVRSGEIVLEREEIHIEETVIDPLQDDVALQLIDIASEESIKKAVIGTQVMLEMKYALHQGSVLQGVLPHNCVVYTADGKHLTHLLDENGCRASNSPVEPFRIVDNKIQTPWFKLFTFENESSVIFRCAYDLCVTSDCKVGCRQTSRKRRDTKDVTDEVAHSTTRTIRVLPRIPATGDSQAEDYQPARPPSERINKNKKKDR